VRYGGWKPLLFTVSVRLSLSSSSSSLAAVRLRAFRSASDMVASSSFSSMSRWRAASTARGTRRPDSGRSTGGARSSVEPPAESPSFVDERRNEAADILWPKSDASARSCSADAAAAAAAARALRHRRILSCSTTLDSLNVRRTKCKKVPQKTFKTLKMRKNGQNVDIK